MVKPDNDQQQSTFFFSVRTLLIFLFFLLPIILPSLFVWMNMLLAVPVIFFFQTAVSERLAVLEIRNGILLAAVGALLLEQQALFVFSLAMLPLGYSLYRSLQHGDSPATAGGVGIVVLSLSWLVFWFFYGMIAGINPYTNLLLMLDRSLAQIIEVYRTNSELPTDVLYNLELIISGMRTVLLPKILPGLLAGTAVLTVWLNMVTGNYLLRRLQPDKPAWPQFRYWQLPDKLIWLLIAAVILSIIGPGSLMDTGYCLVIVSVLLYFFQGAAIFIHLLNHWNVPVFWRIVLYIIIAAQSYGILLLAVAGIAETWGDFRKLAQDK